MAVHAGWLQEALNDWLAGKTVKAMLVSLIDEHQPWNPYRDSIANEVVGAGYTAGGVAVTGLTLTYDDAFELAITCDVVDFGTVTLDYVMGVVFYVDTGDPATDYVLAVDPFFDERQMTVDNEPLTYTPSDDGIIAVTLGVPDA